MILTCTHYRDSSHPGNGIVVVDGFDTVTEILSRGLDIQLASPVETIRWSRHGVQTEGGVLSANAGVATVPPSVVLNGGLTSEPPRVAGRTQTRPLRSDREGSSIFDYYVWGEPVVITPPPAEMIASG